jgi:phosphoenolpyruvate-protein kinase (PTS system EI component)
VLVVPHLDPRLAAVIPRLGGLVAETGSPLSHLAILARERGVAIVVGVSGATTRFAEGELVTVDGHTGAVTSAGASAPAPAVASHERDADVTLDEMVFAAATVRRPELVGVAA